MTIDPNPSKIAKKAAFLSKTIQQYASALPANSSSPKPNPNEWHNPRSSLICYIAYEDGHLGRLLLAHITVILSLCLMGYMLYEFIRKKHHFPIRERAPKLAILQGGIFMMGVVITYFIDVMLVTTDVWQNDNPNYIGVSRRILKAMFLVCRINNYMVFIVR